VNQKNTTINLYLKFFENFNKTIKDNIMSEIHTLRGRLNRFQDLVEDYENQAAEREYEIARLDAERAAAEASLQRAQQAELDRAKWQAQINNQLQGEMRNLRVKQEEELQKIHRSNNQEIQNLNNKFQNEIAATKQKNANDINQLRIETKNAIDDHKAAVKRVTDNLNKKVGALNTELNKQIQEYQKAQLDAAKTREEKMSIVKNTIDALDFMLSIHEVDERSPMKHKETKAEGFGLDEFRDKLTEYNAQINSNMSESQLDKIFTDIRITFNDVEQSEFTAHAKSNEKRERFSSILAGMDALILVAEKNATFKIDALIAEKSNTLNDDNTWKEEREPREEEVEFWTNGEFKTKLEARKNLLEELKILDRSNGIHPNLTDDFLTGLEKVTKGWEKDFLDIRHKAKRLAVNSNLREVEAYRIVTKLHVQFGSDGRPDIKYEDSAKMPSDPRSRIHVNGKFGGKHRHFILDCDSESEDKMGLVASSGHDYNVNGDITQEEADLIMKYLIESLDLVDDDGKTSQTVKNKSHVCGEVREYSKGMTKVQLQENGLSD
jgi:hypothetical protein